MNVTAASEQDEVRISRTTITVAFALTILATLLATARDARADTAEIVQCGRGSTLCTSTFTVEMGGVERGAGVLVYDQTSGEISLDFEQNFAVDDGASNLSRGVTTSGNGLMWDMGNGVTIMVGNLYGNADPILGFAVAASTGGSGATFGFNFGLPIAIEGQIAANSSVSYSLTATSSAGAQIAPVSGNVVKAYEVDTSVGGLGSVSKGVDVGDLFFFDTGVGTQNSPVYTNANTLSGDLAYDLMAVEIDFALSADSNVALSGFVQQVVVPLPAGLPLLLSGLAGAGVLARRRRNI